MAGMMPPLQLSLGSSAKSGDAMGGSAGGAGVGSLSSGDWFVNKTGSGDISAATGGKVNWLHIALAAGAVWLMVRK